MALKFDIEENKFPMILHVKKGQEAVLGWRLPGLAPAAEKQEETGFYELRWNTQSNAWEMQYGTQNGMPNTPWNFALIELDIYLPDQSEPLFGGSVESVSESVSSIHPEGSLDPDKVYRVRIKEASPFQVINIFQKGSERRIKRFEELYKPKASPYLQFVNTETVADYILELKSEEWLVFKPNENAPNGQQLVFGVEKILEDWAIEELMKNLNKLVRWQQILGFYNPNTAFETDEIYFEIRQLNADGEAIKTFLGTEIEIELAKNNDRYESVEIQITAENRGKRNLLTDLLYFSSNYEIQLLGEITELYPGGQEVEMFSGELTIPDPKLQEVKEIFKLMVSDKKIPSAIFTQEKIDVGRIIGPTRNLAQREDQPQAHWPTGMAWTEQTFMIHLKAKPDIEESYTQTVQEPPIQQQKQSKKARPKTIRSRIINWREVQELVSTGQTDKALDLALELAERYDRKRLYENLIVLKSRQTKLQRDVNLGLISSQDAQVQQGQIISGLLDMTNEED